MTQRSPQGRLPKELGLFAVFAIATGATLSSGLFLLPGLAAQQAGPAVVLCYLLAAVPLIPAMFSIVELSTAMPRAGGAYYFLDRSLGPVAGTVGGLGTWLALALKTAFALVGMGAYLALYFPEAPFRLIACLLAVAFGVINALGAKGSGRFQVFLVVAVLLALAWFIVRGMPEIQPVHFQGFLGSGFPAIIATTGTVYISYVGVTKVASVSEEVADPERNLAYGIFLALGTAVAVYLLSIAVIVGVVPQDVLAGSLTPVAEAARRISGEIGAALVSVAAILAFTSIANAGILSCSRYPLAMARDRLLPEMFARVGERGTPVIAIAVTVALVLAFVLLFDPLKIAKLASAFQLLMFALLCAAVIVMRESGIESYDPGYRSPLYPGMQVAGIVLPFWLIAEMGRLPLLFSIGLLTIGGLWYAYYARGRVERHGAIYHVFERLGHQRFGDLDRELRGILKEKGLRAEDPFEMILARAQVIDLDSSRDWTYEEAIDMAARRLAPKLDCAASQLVEGFLEGTRTGATPVTHGVVLPHLRLPGVAPTLVLLRSRQGLTVSSPALTLEDRAHAVFCLVSADENPGQHLRLLAELATRVDEEGFLRDWLAADDEHGLKEILLRHDRSLSVVVEPGTRTGALANRPLRELRLPPDCLVAIIRRGEETIVPSGRTIVREHDRLTFIGVSEAMQRLRAAYGEEE